ncbi:MAG TPA: hypothetical protein VNY35_05665 [Solirubrobacteraceae bacterium]|nr:hypothetical protein [Solirubrobacteraceae bacterium]
MPPAAICPGYGAHRRLIGNFPQAFTHLTLVQAAKTLASPAGDLAARYSQSQPARKTPLTGRERNVIGLTSSCGRSQPAKLPVDGFP